MKFNVIDSPVNWEPKVLSQLQEKISPFVFIEQKEKEAVNEQLVELGIYVQDAILDKNDGLTIKYVELPNIALYRVCLKDHRFSVEGPSRSEIITMAQERYSTIVERSHQALLPSIYEHIVRIEEVAVYLRPLEKILSDVTDDGFVRPSVINKPAKKVNQYFNLLKNLNYLKQENEDYYVAGDMLYKFGTDKQSPAELYKHILANVIEAGSSYIHDVMRLPLINTYLKWANAYYFPAYRVGKLINVKKADYISEYTGLYGKPRELAQINRLAYADIIKKNRDDAGIFYEGYPDTFYDFTKRADNMNILAAPVAR